MAFIIFDLDGTLIDSAPDLALALDAALEHMQLPLAGEDRTRCWVGNGATKLIERALSHACVDVDAYRDQTLAAFFEYYHSHCADRTKLYTGVKETLAELKRQQVSMAIATNKPARFIQPIIQSLGIDGYFDLCVGGDDFPNKKPHPESLLYLMDNLGFVPSESLMVGDSLNDIYAAQRAGIPVVAVSYGYNHGESVVNYNPDRVIDCFSDLLHCLPELIKCHSPITQT